MGNEINFKSGDRVLVRNSTTNEMLFGTFASYDYDDKNCVFAVSLEFVIKIVDDGFTIKKSAHIPLSKNIFIGLLTDDMAEAYDKKINAFKAL